MRSTEHVFCYLIVATLAVLPTLGRAETDHEAHKPCNTSELIVQCGKNERCRVTNTGIQRCDCQRDFSLVNGECIKITSTAANAVTTIKPEQRSEAAGGTFTPSGATYNALSNVRMMLSLAKILRRTNLGHLFFY
ncbi:uncharacterized protein LOC105194217 isoform X2 [Solenopsis invicta]|uniref:uncharacterized protein LOC105194217 isoform X2 n=1 Tax=Solenopsis invicta TaxID=13686 RepID=UPI000595D4CB|nr:uncharacterized protein LOC105194217 isoform X2 [Solenopsis invicta]